MDKYLICGLGNPGAEYAGTRHNTGFMVLDAFAKASNIVFEDGGHNGLGHIQQLIGQNYPRLRMGIGNEYPRGGQVDWVLGHYDEADMQVLQPAIDTAVEIIKSFVLAGIDITMNQFNQQGKKKGGK